MIKRKEIKRADAAEKLLNRRKARNSLLDFTTYTMPKYKVNWHHELICRHVDQLLAGEFQNLMISCPARNGKSEIVSRRLPAYVLGKNPDAQIIACSYSAGLASRMNKDTQRIIESKAFSAVFPDTKLASAKVQLKDHSVQNASMFQIVGHSGYYISAGVKGSITGSGFNEDGIGIIDDPFKNREEAESETIREKVWDWYESTFLTRREGHAPQLLTMTRWHEDDLAGRLLKKAKENPKADQWKVITLPALSEEVRPEYDIRPAANVPLWPEMYDLETLEGIRATVSAYTWLSMFQQRPAAAKGNLFKRDNFQYFEVDGPIFKLHTDDGIRTVYQRNCVKFQTCDPAGTKKTSSDFFVLCTWALTPEGDLLLLDVFKTQIEGPDHMKFIQTQYRLNSPLCIGFESVGIGKTTYQNLERSGLNVIDLQPDKDKFTRALSAAIRLGERRVYFKRDAHWLNDWEEELLHFPNVKHDDQTDNFAYADFMLSDQLVVNIPYVQQVANDTGYYYNSGNGSLGDTGTSW
jgi:predicted phage terminase large subunit-like protein